MLGFESEVVYTRCRYGVMDRPCSIHRFNEKCVHILSCKALKKDTTYEM
jgi:hypothetical protein